MIANIKDKATLRAEALARRDTLTTTERELKSRAIAERAVAIVANLQPDVVAAYMPIWSEVDPRGIIAWAHDRGIAVALPTIHAPYDLIFRLHRPGDELEAHRFGTLAPRADASIAYPDVIVAPVIAFDRTGTRLGYGRGFYDRAIAALAARGRRPTIIGVAFSVQEASAIPAEPHDQKLDWIVTEKEMIAPKVRFPETTRQ